MPGKAFLDTNVLIYAVAHDEPRSTQAEELFGPRMHLLSPPGIPRRNRDLPGSLWRCRSGSIPTRASIFPLSLSPGQVHVA